MAEKDSFSLNSRTLCPKCKTVKDLFVLKECSHVACKTCINVGEKESVKCPFEKCPYESTKDELESLNVSQTGKFLVYHADADISESFGSELQLSNNPLSELKNKQYFASKENQGKKEDWEKKESPGLMTNTASKPFPMQAFEYDGLARPNELWVDHSWNIDEVLKRIRDSTKQMKYLSGFYPTPQNDKVILDVVAGHICEIEDFLKVTFPEHFKRFRCVEQHGHSKLLLGSGKKVGKTNKRHLEGSDPTDLINYGTVTCIAEAKKTPGGTGYFLLTAHHVLSNERSTNQEPGIYLSDIEGQLEMVSSSLSGEFGHFDIDNSPKEVDIGALKLRSTLIDRYETSFHDLNYWFTGKDDKLYRCKVTKQGASSGLTTGTIAHTKYTYVQDGVPYGEYLMIENSDSRNRFAIEGDSGALIWSSTGIPLAIVSRERTGYILDGETMSSVILATRLDHCLNILQEKHQIVTVSLKTFHNAFVQTPTTFLCDDLISLCQPEMTFREQIYVSSKPNAMRLIDGTLWICHDKGISAFDLALKEVQTPIEAPKDIRSVYGVTGVTCNDQRYIIISGYGIYQFHANGSSIVSIETNQWYTDVVYTDGHLYAAMRRSSDDYSDACSIRIYEHCGPTTWKLLKIIPLPTDNEQVVTLDVFAGVIRACCLHDDVIYVTSFDGSSIETYGRHGRQLGEFHMARLCHADDTRSILVSDEGNNRIQIWQKTMSSGLKWHKVNIPGFRMKPSGAVFIRRRLYVTCFNTQALCMFILSH